MWCRSGVGGVLVGTQPFGLHVSRFPPRPDVHSFRFRWSSRRVTHYPYHLPHLIHPCHEHNGQHLQQCIVVLRWQSDLKLGSKIDVYQERIGFRHGSASRHNHINELVITCKLQCQPISENTPWKTKLGHLMDPRDFYIYNENCVMEIRTDLQGNHWSSPNATCIYLHCIQCISGCSSQTSVKSSSVPPQSKTTPFLLPSVMLRLHLESSICSCLLQLLETPCTFTVV